MISTSLLLLSPCISPQALAKDATTADNWSISYHRSAADDTSQLDLAAEEPTSDYVRTRAALSYIRADNDYKYVGVGLSVRSQPPWKVAPFVGSGLFLEVFGNDVDNMTYLMSIYPEAGIHVWLSDTVRLSASSRYHISSWGRDSDRRLDGLELSVKID